MEWMARRKEERGETRRVSSIGELVGGEMRGEEKRWKGKRK